MMARFLNAIGTVERALCVAAFAVMSVALIADVVARELFSTGLVGAPQIGVVGMVAAAMFGMGVATDSGAHLRPRLFDRLVPEHLSDLIDRIANAVTALFFLGMGVLAVLVVGESFELGDRMAVLNWYIWPMQAMIAAAFLTNALRFAAFCADPSLKPPDDAGLVDVSASEETT